MVCGLPAQPILWACAPQRWQRHPVRAAMECGHRAWELATGQVAAAIFSSLCGIMPARGSVSAVMPVGPNNREVVSTGPIAAREVLEVSAIFLMEMEAATTVSVVATAVSVVATAVLAGVVTGVLAAAAVVLAGARAVAAAHVVVGAGADKISVIINTEWHYYGGNSAIFLERKLH